MRTDATEQQEAAKARRARSVGRTARSVILFLPFLLPVVPSAPHSLAQKPQFPDIRNFLWLPDGNCTGGQPPMGDLARLKAAGVNSVLNLRRASEFDEPREARTARRLGLRYFLIPVDPEHPTDAEVEQFLAILARASNRPVFIHCRTADRVGAFWMIRRVLVDQWSVGAAEREAKKIGLTRDNLRAFALDYIRRHRRQNRPDE